MASFGDVDRNVTITFIGRDNASRAMSSIGSSASRTSRIVTGLTKALKYAAMAAAAALAAGALLAAKGLWDATKAAYADDLAMKKLALTQMKAQDATKAQTKATSDFIDKMELATGIADDEMRPALAALALTGMSVKRSQELLTVAMDLSVAKGKSLQTVSEALAKGYNGQITGLSRLGVKTTDAAGEALSFAEILKTLKERTQGAAKAAGRTDPLKRMSAAWHQLQEDLGKGFLPLLRQFARYVISTVVPYVKNELVPAVKRFSAWIKNEAVPWIQNKLIPALQDAWKEFRENWLPTINDLWKKASKLTTQIADLADSIMSLIGVAGSNGEDGGVARVFGLIGQAFSNALIPLKTYISFVSFMIDKWQWVIDHAAAFKNAITGDTSVNMDAPGATSTAPLHRAAGGWTMVGEHGPELINNRGFVRPHSASMGGTGGGGITVIVQGAIDPVGTARQIRQILARGDRASGRGALGLA